LYINKSDIYSICTNNNAIFVFKNRRGNKYTFFETGGGEYNFLLRRGNT